MSGNQPADAGTVANDVQKKMNDKEHGGADSAYQTLLHEATDATKGMNHEQQAAFYKQLNSNLQDKGLLGVMSLEYAKDPNNFSMISEGSIRGQQIDQTSVARDKATADTYGAYDNNPIAAFHSAMDQNLLNAFQQASDGKSTFLGDNGAYGLSSQDVNNALGDATKTYTQVQGEINNRNNFPGLLDGSNGNGKPSTLFNVLDTAKDGGNADGKISKDDINAYIQHAQQVLKDTGHDPNDFSSLPKTYDPKDPGSIYNQEFVKEAQNLQQHFGDYSTHHFGGFFWESDYITKDSLSKAFGFDKTGGDVFSGKPATPGDGGNPPAAGGDHKLTEENAKKGVEDYLSLPDSIAQKLFPPDSNDPNAPSSKRSMTPDTVAQVLKDGGLTPNQEAYLKSLQSNWPNADNKPVSLDDVVKTAGYSMDANAPNSIVKHEQEESAQVKSFLGDVSNNINLKQSFGDKPITPDSIQARMDAISNSDHPDPNNPELKTLQAMKDHFNDISRDGGKTISADDLKSYAGAYSDTFNGFKADGSPSNPGDGIPQSVKDQWSKVPQQYSLGKDGQYLYDVAAKSLADRAQLTGEPVNQKAIWHEIARIVVDNAQGLGVSQANVDYLNAKLKNPDSNISGADLPAVLNRMHTGQTFNLYTPEEVTKYEKMIADKQKPSNPNSGDA